MSGMHGRALPPIPGRAPATVQPRNVVVDFFLPTGIMVTVPITQSSCLREMKELVFKEAKKYPLYSLLKDQGFYNFVGITSDGEKEEFINEGKTLDELDLFMPMLKLLERQGNQDEKLLNAEISDLIGRRLHDFDIMGAEVQDFRRNMLDVCENAVNERTSNETTMVLYNYPPNLVAMGEVNDIDGVDIINVTVCCFNTAGKQLQTTLKMDVGSCPREVVDRAKASKELRKVISQLDSNSLVLKVAGKEEYMLEEKSLSQYKYIRDCIGREKEAKLIMKNFQELIPAQKDQFVAPVFQTSHVKTLRSSTDTVSIWDVKETYAVKILSARNVNVAENQKLFVRASVYHGSEPVCDSVVTSLGANPDNAEWNELLEFNIPVREIPRAAKLCFIVFARSKKTKNQKKDVAHVAWVNMTVFNYEGELQTNKFNLYAWPIDFELEESVHYMGSTVLNPSTSECLCLEVEIKAPLLGRNVGPGKTIIYPPKNQIMELAREVDGVSISANRFPPQMVNNLEKVVEQDPLAQLDEQDKELIWKMRNVCLEQFPNSLPKLLQSTAWNNRSDTAQLYMLLDKWHQLLPETAMELLDYQYADINVRNFAVTCLEVLSDDKLHMYLLQLVQVLKFEPYLDCALGEFLLRRALKSKTIGHFFFWHLRAEMHLSTVSVRFGLMLEAYCRGCGQYMKELSSQLNALNKMKHVTSVLQGLGKKKTTDEVMKYLHEPSFTSAMENITSPLDPSLKLRRLIVDKCKVMDSKMRPIWIVFQNEDANGDNVAEIFKNGDDLRQDMLTLQIMTIMDNVWKELGLNLRMNPYGCLSTGDQVGMIEVVLNSSTIAKIQKKKGAKGAFDKKILFQWLKDQNQDSGTLDKAVENFTYSCAGCCVATYILGIGDRHSDNIMLKKNGQLVHIDFGHFLGNFKSKFGVKRERVPFVLTDDFIYIITKGGTKDSKEFLKFKQLCEDAFLKMRNKGPLFLNLFTMMLSCGIPELRTRDDILYIRDALSLGESEDVALENFRKKLAEAVSNSHFVTFNWFCHNVARAGN